jgi:outer membrane protein assembly factor BamD (BamD/ComL family)
VIQFFKIENQKQKVKHHINSNIDMKINKLNLVVSLSIVLVVAVMVSCNSPEKQLKRDRARVLEVENALHAPDQNLPGMKAAEEAIVVFREFANKYPQDSMAFLYHVKAADIAFTLQQYPVSAEIFEEITEKYPQREGFAYVYLRLGSLYNDKLQDTARARTYFTRILSEYPNNQYVESAKFGLEFLGLNERQQMEVILQRNEALERAAAEAQPAK